MNSWFTTIRTGSCAAVFYLLISGCTMIETSIDPIELFNNTLNELSTGQYDIKWEDTGTIINEHPMNMDWNPFENLELSQQSENTFTIDQQLSDQRAIVVSVNLDNQTAKELLLDQLHNQMNDIRTQLPLVNKSINDQLSNEEKTRMGDEIRAYIDRADLQLLEWLNTSQVHSSIQLWVDRGSDKPIRIEFNTAIDYISNGQQLKERISDSFLITHVE